MDVEEFHTLFEPVSHPLGAGMTAFGLRRGTNIHLIVLCAFISPYRAEREAVRRLVPEGEFIEVFVDTPIDECVRRDPKGLYAKAKAGTIKNFTGFDAPYEPPTNPEILLQTIGEQAEALADLVVKELATLGIV